ncbi:DUF1127 domain-containing protein [Paracoccus jiaweipingae]|uniref:DUF1127 domain-containing protein n=1 Tax=unclassified Paracoccus (in: a-proteobacteria) TaxID=2688777 RepID=UPI003796ADA3
MASTDHSFARPRQMRGLMAALRLVSDSLRQRLHSRRTLRQLSAMTDRDLAEMGLDRRMLSRVANEAAARVRH